MSLPKAAFPLKREHLGARANQASRQGHRVADDEGRIVRSEGEKLLPEALLELPEIGCLSGESGAMHSQEVREEVVGVVTPEVREKLSISVSSSILRNSPTPSMARTSESKSVGAGPRSRRRPRSGMRSSVRQKTAMMKVLRSTRAETSF